MVAYLPQSVGRLASLARRCLTNSPTSPAKATTKGSESKNAKGRSSVVSHWTSSLTWLMGPASALERTIIFTSSTARFVPPASIANQPTRRSGLGWNGLIVTITQGRDHTESTRLLAKRSGPRSPPLVFEGATNVASWAPLPRGRPRRDMSETELHSPSPRPFWLGHPDPFQTIAEGGRAPSCRLTAVGIP